MTQACLKEDDKVYGACEGECDARMIFPTSKENGFYNVELDWSREYLPYFSIETCNSTSYRTHYDSFALFYSILFANYIHPPARLQCRSFRQQKQSQTFSHLEE